MRVLTFFILLASFCSPLNIVYLTVSQKEMQTLSKNLPKTELKCLVDNAFYEARGEGMVGIFLVTQVVINRSNKTKESYCKTIYKHKQFSWTVMKNLKLIPSSVVKELEYLVLLVHTGAAKSLIPLHLADSMFYHAAYVKPKWFKTRKKLGVWKNHIFYE